MSGDFYKLFPDTEYILICHLDAWIFRDELDFWCNQGYDLIAAPWIMKPIYNYFPFKQFYKIRSMLSPKFYARSWVNNKIGNGGLCLRRVSACIKACNVYSKEINHFIEQGYNEDKFWAVIPQDFKYPSVRTALHFSFDIKPALCYRLNNKKLPMGCHGFIATWTFWRKFISLK